MMIKQEEDDEQEFEKETGMFLKKIEIQKEDEENEIGQHEEAD